MNLVKKTFDTWDPFEALTDLQNDMNRAFNRSLTQREPWVRNFQPVIDVREESDRYLLHADIPGLKKEEFSISVQGNHLTLKGERKEEKETKDKERGFYYSERSYGAFSRSLEFPTDIQAEKVNASYKDGVLEITLPKAEHAKPKQINVEIK